MSAFSAAKRNALVALGLLLILNAGQTSAGEDGQGYLGVMLQDITPSMAKALQLEGQSGVMINQVVDDSPAAQAGLEDGDIILEFQGQPIHDYNDLTRAVRRSPPGEKVELLILHGGKKQTLWVELGEKKKSSGGHVFTNDDEDFWVNGFRKRERLVAKLHQLGADAAEILNRHLQEVLGKYRRILILTHVTPFVQTCTYKDNPGTPQGFPGFLWDTMGSIIRREAEEHPETEFLVFSGHTHEGSYARIAPNIQAWSAPAEYGELRCRILQPDWTPGSSIRV